MLLSPVSYKIWKIWRKKWLHMTADLIFLPNNLFACKHSLHAAILSRVRVNTQTSELRWNRNAPHSARLPEQEGLFVLLSLLPKTHSWHYAEREHLLQMWVMKMQKLINWICFFRNGEVKQAHHLPGISACCSHTFHHEWQFLFEWRAGFAKITTCLRVESQHDLKQNIFDKYV